MNFSGPVWLMQPIPYFGEELKGDWIVEPKIDGWRMQIISYLSGKIEFWGRRLEKKPNWTEKLLYLINPLKNLLPQGTLLDCELYSEGGRRFIPSLFARHPKVKPLVYVFDVIFWEGEFVGRRPLNERKRILSSLKFNPPFYQMEFHFWEKGDIKEEVKNALQKGWEGIVLKKWDSLYKLIEEGPVATIDWRKVK